MVLPKTRIKLLLLFVLLLLIPSGVMAAEFNLTPSLSVREEYNDNIFFEYDDTVDDFITTVSAGLELTQRTEQLDLSLSGNFSQFYYADNSDRDSDDQNYTGKINYQVSPMLAVNANAGYTVSNRPDRDVYTTGLVLSSTERETETYGIGFDYTLSEISAVAVSFDYSEDRWDEVTLDDQNSKNYGSALNYTHSLNQWWEETTGRLNLGFSRSDYDTLETDNYFAAIGIQHWFSQTINLLMDVGVRYSDADYSSPQAGEENNTSFGGTGQAVLEIQGELTQGRVSLRHGITSGSGRGQTVERTEAVIDLTRRLAEKLAVGIALGFYHNSADKDEFSLRRIDEDAYYVRPTLQWEIFRNFTLGGGYVFTYINDHEENNHREQNMVYLQAAYGVPLFE